MDWRHINANSAAERAISAIAKIKGTHFVPLLFSESFACRCRSAGSNQGMQYLFKEVAGNSNSGVMFWLNQPVNNNREIELFSEVWKLFSQSCSDVLAQLPSAMLPRQARGTCKKTVIQTSETVLFVSWYCIALKRHH